MSSLHKCGGYLPYRAYGQNVLWCIEEADGKFWVGDGEGETQVNFCPYCGQKAPTPAIEETPIDEG